MSFRILAVTDMRNGYPMAQRVNALRDLTLNLSVVDVSPVRNGSPRGVVRRGLYWLYRRGYANAPLLEYRNENERVLECLRQRDWDILWLDKALTITGDTLKLARKLRPRCQILGFCHDDAAHGPNMSAQFYSQLPHYDRFFTTKSFNVAELRKLGCPHCEFIDNSYDPYTHRPLALSFDDQERYRSDVCFIGAWERERELYIRALAEAGIAVSVWGDGWTGRLKGSSAEHRGRDLLGDQYAAALCAAKIALCFLRKRNRDLQTTRTIEIPACGAFLLAERTTEHQSLFAEGWEAAYFEGSDELVLKTRHYLERDRERREIAQRGRQRCLDGGYSNHDRLRSILSFMQIR